VSDPEALTAVGIILCVCLIWTAYAVRRVMDR
jgi:hypothetical protein